jgi:cysteine desulfurase
MTLVDHRSPTAYDLEVIYLDHNATTPLRIEVVDAMRAIYHSNFANPSSTHAQGRSARAMVESARDEIRHLVGAPESRLWFTSGSTESIFWFFDSIGQLNSSRSELLIPEFEHKAVITAAQSCSKRSKLLLVMCGISPNGLIDLDDFERCLSAQTRVFALMAVNNETGIVQPIEKAFRIAKSHGALTFTDATQAIGKIHFDSSRTELDAFCFNAHKFGGPTGIGALVLNSDEAIRAVKPWIPGGGQEGGLRGGTLNVAGIIGLAVALRYAVRDLASFNERCAQLSELFLKLLSQSSIQFELNGARCVRASNTLSIWLPGIDAEALVARLHDIAISTGSACQSSAPSPSHVLLSMQQDVARARETIRVSFGWVTERQDVVFAVRRLLEEIQVLSKSF